jgi:hypothetical protein
MYLLSISYSLKLVDTDQPTDRQTDIATYRAAIAAKKGRQPQKNEKIEDDLHFFLNWNDNLKQK